MLQGHKNTLSMAFLLVMLVACGGRPRNTGNILSLAAVDHLSAVRGFMDAVKSGSISTLAGLWGTSDGLAAEKMDREELVQRLRVIMTYLAHDEYTITEEMDAIFQTDNEKVVTVRVSRGNCVSAVPFTIVRSGDGWLVKGMDLEAIVSPRGRCRR